MPVRPFCLTPTTIHIPPLTKPTRRILNSEQIAAHQAAARAANPNRLRIDELRAQAKGLFDQAAALTSDEEKYLNILAFLSIDFDSRIAAVKVMSDNELGDHLSNIFFEHATDEMSEAILMEALERIGWEAEDET